MIEIDVATLSQEERLALLEQLWESLSATSEGVSLTPDLDREGPRGIPLDEALAPIRGRAF